VSEGDPTRWVWRAITGSTLVLGWLFILWQNKFHVTVPVVIICLGHLAVVATVANLWRVGAAAVAPEDDSPDAWARPIGPRADLEKEKKTLLKAIKEAEFDHAMGKLSKADADELIRSYRARAIEVIKELDRLDAGQAESPREQIRREIQARLALAKDKPNPKDKKKPAKADAKADPAKSDVAKADPAKSDVAKADVAKADVAKADAKVDASADAAKAEVAKADAKVDASADAAKADIKGDAAKADDAKAGVAQAEDATDKASDSASPIEPPIAQPEQDTTEATS
jgi:hypothetical protein